MFLKAVLTFLAVGALSVNASSVPVAQSPAPEPQCEFRRSFSITTYYDLTLASFNSRGGPSESELDVQCP